MRLRHDQPAACRVPEVRAVSQPYYHDEAVTLWHADCREILPTLGPVDHVITDPPYEAEAHTKGRRIVNPRTNELRMAPLSFEPMTLEERGTVSALIAPLVRRWVLVFCQVEAAMKWRSSLESDQLRYMRTMVWVKPNGQPQLTGDRPGVGYESIVVMHVPAASRWNGGGARGYLTHSVDANFSRTPRDHETQKPESLMLDLVTLFTDHGDVILDAYAGSGTTGVAAKRLGRRCILIERNERDCESAARRLSQGALWGGLDLSPQPKKEVTPTLVLEP